MNVKTMSEQQILDEIAEMRRTPDETRSPAEHTAGVLRSQTLIGELGIRARWR